MTTLDVEAGDVLVGVPVSAADVLVWAIEVAVAFTADAVLVIAADVAVAFTADAVPVELAADAVAVNDRSLQVTIGLDVALRGLGVPVIKSALLSSVSLHLLFRRSAVVLMGLGATVPSK